MKKYRYGLVGSVRCEVLRGLYENKTALLLLAIYAIFVGASFLALTTQFEYESDFSDQKFSVIDIMVSYYRGMNRYDQDMSSFFILDIHWITPYLIIGYLVCFSINEDSGHFATQIVVRSRSRLTWYISKLVWGAVIIISFYLFTFVCSCVITVAFGDITYFGPTPYLFAITGLDLSASDTSEIIALLCLALLATITLSLMSALASLLFSPALSYVFLVLMLVCSAYFDSTLLFMNFTMLARSSISISSGFTFITGTSVCIFFSIACFLVGISQARKAEFK